jgi:surfactin synthase thioesterase subunit
MGALVSFVVDQIEPFTNLPYTLLGHSLGAVVAYEALAELRRRRAPAPRRLVASGAPAPHLPRRSREIHRLPDGDFWRAILEMGGTPTALIESEPLKRLVIGTLRADLEVAETYRCSGAPVEIPVLAIAGERDRMVDAERVLAWRDLARADFEFATSPGGHFFVHEHETEVLRLLRDTLVRNETESTRRPAA